MDCYLKKEDMMIDPEIVEKTLGKIQIYIKPKDRIKQPGFMNRLKSKQLYKEIVQYAKDDQLMNASVYQIHSGYFMYGKITTAHVELDNADLFLCVELVDEKSKLENFCKKHAELLIGKMIVFKAVTSWEIKTKL
ncbi:PII-like signaling protein [Pedobacter sp. UYEF25]